MTFMNPWLLFGALGIGLPILAHLLNRYKVKQTDWAAMQFLNRSVRIRSRQLRLKDILLLLLRCAAVILLVIAFSKPWTNEAEGIASKLGESHAGVVIALDASYSMQHSDDTSTRFDRAIEKIKTIAEDIHPGDPVSLILLGEEHKVVARNMAFDPGRFEAILEDIEATPEALDLDSVPRRLKELVESMEAPQKEVYIVTDMQEKNWKDRSAWLEDAFKDIGQLASTCIVPVLGSPDNLAITNLELVSGVLRKGTLASYQATVRNYGTAPVANVIVKGMINNINVDTKTIPTIAPGASETVPLGVSFQNPGAMSIAAELDTDSLPVDNSRRAVAVIRDRVSVLCVEGSSDGSGACSTFIDAALSARGHGAGEEEFNVETVPWMTLPTQDLNSFDVVVLADVPDITPDQAKRFEEYVRAGNGLIWFPGENMKASVWNERSALNGTPLLPASIEQTVSTSDAMGVGAALDPTMPDHAVCRPLRSLSEDSLSEASFLKLLQVKPTATSFTVLSLAGSGAPVLIEHSIGRGHVFMFTTTAEPTWNTMALSSVFPMVMQQMVTYLTAREFEKPRIVGDSLSLSYKDQPDANDAVFDTPSEETITVPVLKHHNQYVALLDQAREVGFYQARVSVQAPGMPIAVNVDTRESDVKCLSASEIASSFEGTDIRIANSEPELIDAVAEARTGRSFWLSFMIAGLAILVVESLLADRLLKNPSPAKQQPDFAPTHTEDVR